MKSVRNQFFKNLKKKQYKRSRTPKLYKCPQKKATVRRLLILSPKKPNSAKRKAARVELDFNKKKTFAYIPGIKHNLAAHSSVLIRGGRVRDLPGMAYKMIRNVYDFAGMKAVDRKTRRSFYGVKNELLEEDLKKQNKKIDVEKKYLQKKEQYKLYKKIKNKTNNFLLLKNLQAFDFFFFSTFKNLKFYRKKLKLQIKKKKFNLNFFLIKYLFFINLLNSWNKIRAKSIFNLPFTKYFKLFLKKKKFKTKLLK